MIKVLLISSISSNGLIISKALSSLLLKLLFLLLNLIIIFLLPEWYSIIFSFEIFISFL